MFVVCYDIMIWSLNYANIDLSSVRQFEAIQSLPHLRPHLRAAVFTSQITTKSKPPKAVKPRSLSTDIWGKISRNYNKFQLSSISSVFTGSCRHNVCLIQGPPGTGKSSTIVGLVSALLSGKATRPNQPQSGCLIHAPCDSSTQPVARNSILVCAPTNVAADSLAWKIKQSAIGTSGKVGDVRVARFGSLPESRTSPMEKFLYDINGKKIVCVHCCVY